MTLSEQVTGVQMNWNDPWFFGGVFFSLGGNMFRGSFEDVESQKTQKAKMLLKKISLSHLSFGRSQKKRW